MSTPKYSIVIPAFNESARIPATLKSVLECIRARGWQAEVLVVNDGSTDGGVDVVEMSVGQEYHLGVGHVRRPQRLGRPCLRSPVEEGVDQQHATVVLDAEPRGPQPLKCRRLSHDRLPSESRQDGVHDFGGGCRSADVRRADPAGGNSSSHGARQDQAARAASPRSR